MNSTFQWKNKRVFITGGTGTWGQEFTRQLLAAGVEAISIYSRGEYRQVEMRRAFQGATNVRYSLGDVRDAERLASASSGHDVIIHLAALKHVPVVEENANEAIKTNVIGTQNVIDAALANSVSRVLYVSSDKAVDPLNFYGITKLASERMIQLANQESPNTRMINYRAGNVMGSAGSVIPIFQETLSRDNAIRLTDASMTRFFLSKSDVVSRACESLEIGVGGEIFVPKMRATSLQMLADVMIKHLGTGDVKVEHIGIRPGEKIHELLISRNEISRTRELERLWVILPFFPNEAMESRYSTQASVAFDEFSSTTADQFSFEELEALLDSEAFLQRVAPPAGPLYFKKGSFDFH